MSQTDKWKLLELYMWWVIAENSIRPIRWLIRRLVIVEARSYWDRI